MTYLGARECEGGVILTNLTRTPVRKWSTLQHLQTCSPATVPAVKLYCIVPDDRQGIQAVWES